MDAPLTFTARIVVRPEHIDDFRKEFELCATLAAQEPSCLWLYATQLIEDPRVFLTFEHWTSSTAFRAETGHSDYFNRYLEGTKPWLEEERKVEFWAPIVRFARRAD
jgi:quinol monooxygenase YgiN